MSPGNRKSSTFISSRCWSPLLIQASSSSSRRKTETARTQTRKGIQAADWHEGAGAHMGWMREQLDAMRDHDTVRRVVDTDRLTALLDDWPTEGWHRRDTALAYRSALLRGISIGHFLRRASGSNR